MTQQDYNAFVVRVNEAKANAIASSALVEFSGTLSSTSPRSIRVGDPVNFQATQKLLSILIERFVGQNEAHCVTKSMFTQLPVNRQNYAAFLCENTHLSIMAERKLLRNELGDDADTFLLDVRESKQTFSLSPDIARMNDSTAEVGYNESGDLSFSLDLALISLGDKVIKKFREYTEWKQERVDGSGFRGPSDGTLRGRVNRSKQKLKAHLEERPSKSVSGTFTVGQVVTFDCCTEDFGCFNSFLIVLEKQSIQFSTHNFQKDYSEMDIARAQPYQNTL